MNNLNICWGCQRYGARQSFPDLPVPDRPDREELSGVNKDICIFFHERWTCTKSIKIAKTPFYFSYSSWWPWHVHSGTGQPVHGRAGSLGCKYKVLATNAKYRENNWWVLWGKIWITLNVLHYQRQLTSIKACMNTDRICFARPLSTF